jgi:hypothetical protein
LGCALKPAGSVPAKSLRVTRLELVVELDGQVAALDDRERPARVSDHVACSRCRR